MQVRPSVSLLPASPPRSARQAGLPLDAQYWRYVSRLAPWTLIATGALLGVAWSIRTHLDDPLDPAVLAAVTTAALSVVFEDDAYALTGPVPAPLWVRRLSAATVPVLVLFLSWVATVIVAISTSGDDRVASLPWWAMALEWSTVAASQLALGAMSARRHPGAVSILPGLILGLVWICAAGAPIIQRRLRPVETHPILWCVLLVAAAAWIALSSQEVRRGRAPVFWVRSLTEGAGNRTEKVGS